MSGERHATEPTDEFEARTSNVFYTTVVALLLLLLLMMMMMLGRVCRTPTLMKGACCLIRARRWWWRMDGFYGCDGFIMCSVRFASLDDGRGCMITEKRVAALWGRVSVCLGCRE